MNSINGVVLSVKGDVKNVLLKVDVAMKDSAKKMFNVFADSLKLVIAGILPIGWCKWVTFEKGQVCVLWMDGT